MHTDIQVLLDELSRANQRAESLSRQVQVPSNRNAWTAAECLDHLAKTNLVYSAAMRQAVTRAIHLERPGAPSPIRPGWFTRQFIARMEPDSGTSFQAPEIVRPSKQVDMTEALHDFLLAQAAIESLLRETAEMDLNRIRFRNPFVRWIRFTVGAGFLILAAHNRRHLAQAERLCQHENKDDTPSTPGSRAAAGGA